MALPPYTEKIITSKGDDERAILDIMSELFKTTPAPLLSLTNIYKELPITNSASIMEIKGRRVELETKEIQVSAICTCMEVLIQAPSFPACIIGRLDTCDLRRSTVTLSNFQYVDLHHSQRTSVRVMLQRPLNVVMEAGSNTISGVIRDLSLSGCCINILVNQGLSSESGVQMNLKLIQQSTGKMVETKIPARIIRIDGDRSPFKCALAFNHTPQTEQTLSMFIYQRQLEIINELREKA